MRIYRQGDVLIVARETSAPTLALGKKVPRNDGRIVLAYGEVTGHAHAIADPEADLYELEGTDLAERFLDVLAEGGVDLEHEEHATVTLPKGHYRVLIQREYTPWGERQVAD